MKHRLIPESLISAILQYMNARPHGEVRHLFDQFLNLPLHEEQKVEEEKSE
jgi:hypothetical protein